MQTERFFFYAIKAWIVVAYIIMIALTPIATVFQAFDHIFHRKTEKKYSPGRIVDTQPKQSALH